MAPCANCGRQFPDNAKFCPECGTPVIGKQPQNPDQRTQVFEGEIRRCPNCWESLNSFMTNCPGCGYEIRHAKVASAAKELAAKLERIDSQKISMEYTESSKTIKPIGPGRKKESVMKKVVGWDFAEGQLHKRELQAQENEHLARIQEAQFKERQFERQKAREKANLVRNFPIPNTKEDILEFILLATVNIDFKRGINSVVSKAWITKLDQVYQKAEISFNSKSDFEKIKDLCIKTKEKIKRAKLRKMVLVTISVLLLLFLVVWCVWGNGKNEDKELTLPASLPIEQSSSSSSGPPNAPSDTRDTVNIVINAIEDTANTMADDAEELLLGIENFVDDLAALHKSMTK